MQIAVVILFILMYVLMITMPKRKVITALCVAAVFLIMGVISPLEALRAINWNVLMMIAGTMVIVDYFIESKMPNLLAEIIMDKSANIMWVTILLSLFAGIVSAFIDNVATVLMIAPVAIAICRKLNISPVGMIISIAVSSNLQGAATLVGDTTAIMLGAYANMDFMQFIWMHGKPGIFFAVELGALATVPIMMFLFRKEKDPVSAETHTRVTDYFPTVVLVGIVVLLIAASFIDSKPDITNGLICLALAVVMIVYDLIRNRDTTRASHALKSIDFETLLLLTGLFIVIGGVTEAGIIDIIADAFARIGRGNIFLLYTIIVWGSVAVSAFVDNIPYVATMLPVIASLTRTMGVDPYLLYFGLLSGATLGGNLTPIGASANITAVGMLKKNGYETSFGDFMKIGVPFTLTAVTVGYLFIWFVWR